MAQPLMAPTAGRPERGAAAASKVLLVNNLNQEVSTRIVCVEPVEAGWVWQRQEHHGLVHSWRGFTVFNVIRVATPLGSPPRPEQLAWL